jgi:hypothetical protein
MKKYINLVYSILLMSIVLVSCRDDESVRFDIDEMQEAVNLRIQRNVGTFDATDPDAAVNFTLYSENDDLGSIEMLVDLYQFAPNTTTQQVKFKELDGSTITNDGSTKLTIPLTELTSALGITPADLSGGDILSVYTVVTLEDGRVYPDTILAGTSYETLNVDAGIISNSATHSFSPLLRFPVVCPLDNGFATGNYRLEVIEGSNSSGFGTIFQPGVYAISGTGTRRTLNVPYFPAFGLDADITIDFACNITLSPVTDTGIGCGGPTSTWINNNLNSGTFNIEDDSEFTLSIIHDITDACGGSIPANTPMILKFTKQ